MSLSLSFASLSRLSLSPLSLFLSLASPILLIPGQERHEHHRCCQALPRQSVGVGKLIQTRVRTRFGTFENHCLEGKLTFGDPFLDSGVVPLGGWGWGLRDLDFGAAHTRSRLTLRSMVWCLLQLRGWGWGLRDEGSGFNRGTHTINADRPCLQGVGVWGLGFEVWGLGFRVRSSGFGVEGARLTKSFLESPC